MLFSHPGRVMGALLLLLSGLLAACAPSAAPVTESAPTVAASATEADLSAIKTYLLGQSEQLATHTAALKTSAEQYYALAEAANFDYTALWANEAATVGPLLREAKTQWQAANPAYERMEGVVAGVPSLAEFDVILDAGASAEADPESAVPFDLTLADGRVFPQPGNFFFLTETALWGTEPEWTMEEVAADLDGSGTVDFGEALPDAAFLLAAATDFNRYATELQAAAQAWQPTASDAFTALVVMTPTMSEYFESWKQSRFVAGDGATESGFVGSSRLADIVDILSGLDVIYASLQPMVAQTDEAGSAQIAQSLSDLQTYVADVYRAEQEGKRYTAEEADLLGSEAQARATAIAGQIAQVAAQLDITIVQ